MKKELVGASSPSLTLEDGNVTVTLDPAVPAKVDVVPGRIKISVLPPEGKSQQGETPPQQENWAASFLSKLLSGLGWMAGRFLLEWILKHM